MTRRFFASLIALSFLAMPACSSPEGGGPRWDWWRASEKDESAESEFQYDDDDEVRQAMADRPDDDTRAAEAPEPLHDAEPVDAPQKSISDGEPVDAPQADPGPKVVPAATPRKPQPGAIQPDALLVNNEPIRVSDILEPINPRLEQLAQELPPEAYYQRAAQLVKGQIVEAVAQELIWRRAQDHVTEELKPAIDKAIDKIEKERINREFGGRETVYEKYITKQGRTRDEVRERLKKTVVIDSYLRERLLPLVPAPRRDELLAYYKAHIKDFESPEQRELFLIEIPARAFVESSNVFGPRPEELAAAHGRAKASAQKAAGELSSGKPFEDVAREYSRGPKKDEGGAWGFITTPEDRKEPPLQGKWTKPSRRLLELNSGQVSEIIEETESQTFFIVKCGRIEGGGVTSFGDAQPEIVDALRQQRFMKLRADFLQSELDKSTIGSLDEFMGMVMDGVPRPKG